MRQVRSMALDDGGTAIVLSCGHEVWCPLPPEIFKGTVIGNAIACGACILDYLERAKHAAVSN